MSNMQCLCCQSLFRCGLLRCFSICSVLFWATCAAAVGCWDNAAVAEVVNRLAGSP